MKLFKIGRAIKAHYRQSGLNKRHRCVIIVETIDRRH